MVEYGLIASKSSELLTGVIGQMQGLLDAIPFGSPVAIGAGIAVVLYLLFSETVMGERLEQVAGVKLNLSRVAARDKIRVRNKCHAAETASHDRLHCRADHHRPGHIIHL